jgi:hypothetical protein
MYLFTPDYPGTTNNNNVSYKLLLFLLLRKRLESRPLKRNDIPKTDGLYRTRKRRRRRRIQ